MKSLNVFQESGGFKEMLSVVVLASISVTVSASVSNSADSLCILDWDSPQSFWVYFGLKRLRNSPEGGKDGIF